MNSPNQNETHPPRPPRRQRRPAPIPQKPWLVAVGVLELLLSIFLIGWSMWIHTWDSYVKVSYVSFLCGVAHIILAVLIMVKTHRGIIIARLIVGSVSASIFAPLALGVTAVNWQDHNNACPKCIFDKFIKCPPECGKVEPEVLFAPIIASTLLVAGIGIMLSSISCCNMCRRCGCNYIEDERQNVQVMYPPVTPFSQVPLTSQDDEKRNVNI